jgi:hypothetical protein
VLAPLRNQTFFSIAEANRAIWERLDWLNDRALSRLDGSRRSLWQELDRRALRPLPARRFEIPEWKVNIGVNIDTTSPSIATHRRARSDRALGDRGGSHSRRRQQNPRRARARAHLPRPAEEDAAPRNDCLMRADSRSTATGASIRAHEEGAV